MVHVGGLTNRDPGSRKCRGYARNAPCRNRSIGSAREYTHHAVLGWWEGCLAGHRASAIPIPVIAGVKPSPCLPEEAMAEANAFGTSLATFPPRQAAFRLGQLYCSLLPEAHRSAKGTFYTPPALARLLLDRAEVAGHDWTVGKAVDPSCGAGALLVEAACRMAAALGGADAADTVAAVSTRLVGWDIDPFAAWLAQVAVEIAVLPQVLASGTRLGPVTSARDSLERWDGHGGAYALVMGNPPFGRIKDDASLRARFRRSLHGHPNLYTMFTDLAVHLAAGKGGIVAHLTPAGYLGGRYSRNLRRLLAAEAPPASIDVVVSRDGVFEGVLQEIALSVFRRGSRSGPVACAVTRVGDDRVWSEPAGSLLLPREAGAPWLVPRDARDATMVRGMRSMPSRLSDWGYAVSTGPLVWNRSRDSLHGEPREGSVPVVWAGSVGMDGKVHPVPGTRRAAAYYRPGGPADPNLARGPCLLVRRTTSKEQRRRLVSAILPRPVPGAPDTVCVENHLNMVRATAACPAVPLETLAAFFASATADRVIRCINGSVAVSASELAEMPLPSARAIVRAMASADPERELQLLYGAVHGDGRMADGRTMASTAGWGGRPVAPETPQEVCWPQLRFPHEMSEGEREQALSLMDLLFGAAGNADRPDALDALLRLGGRPVNLPGPDSTMHPAGRSTT